MSKVPFKASRSDVVGEVENLKRHTPLTVTWPALFGKVFHIMYVYRLFSWAHRAVAGRRLLWDLVQSQFGIIHCVVTFFTNNFKGIRAPYEATIGFGLRLAHLRGISLSPQISIGRNCTMFCDLSCGVNHLDRSGYPRIGDNVVLYPGSRVIGNVSVGSTVIIGANSVVIRDISSNSIAVGTPAVTKKTIDSLDILDW